MEKIYMQNNKKQSTFQQIFKSRLSKKLSVSMVLVAFFSFLMIGIGNISYAYPVDIPNTGLGDSFETAAPGDYIVGNGALGTFPVQMYSTTSNIPIFCLERDVNYVDGITLEKQEQITDDGLLYVMANSAPHVKFKDSTGAEFPDQVQTWITQVAIWQYLYETNTDGNVTTGGTGISNLEIAKNTTELYWDDADSNTHYCDVDGCYTDDLTDSTVTFYEKYIAPLVANARQSGVSANGALQVSIANDEISVTDDEKYYQTSLVTISNSNPSSLVSFSVTIASAPDGTVLIDENGQIVEDTTGLDKFYVRIPVDKVTEENKKVVLSATGTFRGYDGYYYRATGAQTVSTVFTTDVPYTTGLEIPITYTPEVPSTGMNIAQSVYFVGLIVLLCGVGIIYANARPKQSQQ